MRRSAYLSGRDRSGSRPSQRRSKLAGALTQVATLSFKLAYFPRVDRGLGGYEGLIACQIVRIVRFPGWQQTSAGEREVKKAPRGALFKYRLHSDKELFEKAYGYIRQYY